MKKLFSLLCSVVLMLSFATACGTGGGTSSGSVRISFLYTGDGTVGDQIAMLVNEYNNGQGKEDKVTVRSARVADEGYDTKMAMAVYDKNSYDVFCVRDEYFKKYTSFFQPLDDLEGAQEIISAVYENQSGRYRYDIENTTSDADDPLYALPVVNGISLMYYNKTLLNEAGVICISVDEDDLDAFNNGTLADLNGKTKEDYGIPSSLTVPARGFYRENAYVKPADETDGSSWVLPASGEVMIFNDRIAMSWDEVEDVAMLMTKSKNASSPTDYGYHTEWWFAYGWSVGGDCIQDISGSGDWKYTLADDTPNYIVASGKTYTGAYTETVYGEGETLEFLDKLDVSKGDVITANDDNTFSVNGSVVSVRAELAEKVADGTLVELPSQREAFTRFAMLAGSGGLNVCPKPAEMSNAITYFNSGRLAFCVESVKYISDVTSAMTSRGNEWGVTLLPVYKTYNEDGTVAKEGKQSAHSLGYGVAINKNSSVQEQAWKFVSWIASEGQQILAENGYLSSRAADEAVFTENTSFPNASILIGLNSTTKPGDWWYMPDREWITNWSNALNGSVRNGTMTLEYFFANYTAVTNASLANYKT